MKSEVVTTRRENLPAPPALTPRTRFFEFFAANIRNKRTPRARAQATREILAWRRHGGVASIADVKPLHVAEMSRPPSS